MIPELEPLTHKLEAMQGRLQLLAPEERGRERSRAVLYHGDRGPFACYRRREATGSRHEILSLASQLLDTPAMADETTARDLLICTHGSRDRCCGSLGTRLMRDLQARADRNTALRLSRTSHTGGHRFAPTALLFPEGTSWGYLDEGVVQRVVERAGPVTDVLMHYRGCAGLSSARIQAVERAVLAQVGWSLFDCPRQGSEQRDGTVLLKVHQADGESVWAAQVRTGRILPVPGCGTPIEPEGKKAGEFVVDSLRRVR